MASAQKAASIVIDNRQDKTTFIRKGRDSWQPAEIKAIHDELSRALKTLLRGRNSL